MTVEERLEKLAERHAALTQTVEITVGMQKKNEQLLAQVIESVKRLARNQAR